MNQIVIRRLILSPFCVVLNVILGPVTAKENIYICDGISSTCEIDLMPVSGRNSSVDWDLIHKIRDYNYDRPDDCKAGRRSKKPTSISVFCVGPILLRGVARKLIGGG